ncbi:hypothetical protein FRC11_001216, partial [Ceratobasidium sp. 423]
MCDTDGYSASDGEASDSGVSMGEGESDDEWKWCDEETRGPLCWISGSGSGSGAPMDPWTPALFSSFPPGFSFPSLPFSVRSYLKMTGTSLEYQVTIKYIQDIEPTGEYLDPYILYAFPENE